MTDSFKLQKQILKSNKRKEAIAAELGISLTSLNNKIANRTEFKASEISSLIRILHISDDDIFNIFFIRKVSEKDTFEVNNG